MCTGIKQPEMPKLGSEIDDNEVLPTVNLYDTIRYDAVRLDTNDGLLVLNA